MKKVLGRGLPDAVIYVAAVVLLALFIFLLRGCEPSPERLRTMERAEEIIWRARFGFVTPAAQEDWSFLSRAHRLIRVHKGHVELSSGMRTRVFWNGRELSGNWIVLGWHGSYPGYEKNLDNVAHAFQKTSWAKSGWVLYLAVCNPARYSPPYKNVRTLPGTVIVERSQRIGVWVRIYTEE